MAIAFKDFFPASIKTGIFSRKNEALEETLAHANDWLSQSGVRVINLETVVFPNVSGNQSSEASVFVQDGFAVEWHQFIRVWYETNTTL